MYLPDFKYPSAWTANWESYKAHRAELVVFIQDKIDNYENYKPLLAAQKRILMRDYLQADVMIENITRVDFTI